MALERELKYSVLDPYVPSAVELQAALQATPFEVVAAPTQELADRYYDDGAGSLRGAGLALRRRRLGGRTRAELKAAGQVDVALHQREEFEASVADADAPWPAAIAARLAGVVDPGALRPLIELSTTRVRFDIRRGEREVAVLGFDAISARLPGGQRSVHFDEVEIEARGDAARSELEAIARAVGSLVQLTPSPVNKLERARALLPLTTW